MKQAKIYYLEEDDSIRIVGFENIAPRERLPREYFRDLPYFYGHEDDDTAFIIKLQIQNYVYEVMIYKGMLFDKAMWEAYYVPAFKEAGAKLSRIIKNNKKKKVLRI